MVDAHKENENMTDTNAPLALAVGDKVRHVRDIEKGWNDYGIGIVQGQDQFGDWNVWFPMRVNVWEQTFARHWIEKV
jgi:hypothetical protein